MECTKGRSSLSRRRGHHGCTDRRGSGPINPGGTPLALGAALVYAAYVLASSTLLRRMDPLALAASAVTGAALVFCGYAFARSEVTVRTDIVRLALVIAVALTSSVIGTAAFLAGVRALGASRASIISTAEPALTALFAWATFGEQVGALQLLGAGLLLASVPILELSRTERPKQSRGRSRRWPVRPALQLSGSPA